MNINGYSASDVTLQTDIQSVCGRLVSYGQDSSCTFSEKRYYQRVVLVNKVDVANFQMYTFDNKNRIQFQLHTGRSGILFVDNDERANVDASYKKKVKGGSISYIHLLSMAIRGVSEEVKVLLRDLDYGDYFAAVHFYDGTIEILGFNTFLNLNSYTYSAQNGLGGTILQFESTRGEGTPPLVYLPKVSNPGQAAIDDFNNLFRANLPGEIGDFNNDFNNDFTIS